MMALPGSTLGILGGGQLGRMLALAARQMGYRICVFTPTADSPAGQVADVEIVASYEDEAALKTLAQQVDVVTIEFENIPVSALQFLESLVPVYPQPHVLETAQNRLREKMFLASQGLPVTPFAAVHWVEELKPATEALGFPLVLKTAGFGYDGKGQAKVASLPEAEAAYQALGEAACILEKFIDLDREISVIAARANDGTFAAYRPVENRHRNHILDVTLAPAALPPEIEAQALAITRQIMDAFGMRGLLCVEFFLTKQGELLVNELAPRTHNSGHYTQEAAICSQFEQHLRAVCGLPLGDTRLRSPAAMANLLGDVWQVGEPDWVNALAMPSVHLHLYGKAQALPGRKMGHINALADSPEAAAQLAIQVRQAITRSAAKNPASGFGEVVSI